MLSGAGTGSHYEDVVLGRLTRAGGGSSSNLDAGRLLLRILR